MTNSCKSQIAEMPKVVMEQVEDNRSTSASGSDSEVEAKCSPFNWSSYEDDSEPDVKRCISSDDEEPKPGKPTPPPPSLGGEVAGSEATAVGLKHLVGNPVKNLLGRVAAQFRCVGRAQKAVGLKPEESGAFGFQSPPPGLELQEPLLDGIPDDTNVDIDLTAITQQGDSQHMEPASTHLVEDTRRCPPDEAPPPRPPPGLAPPPGLSLPPGLALPPGFAPPPGLAAPPGLTLPAYLTPVNAARSRPWAPQAQKAKKERPPPPSSPPPAPPAPPAAPQVAVPKVFNIKDFRKELVAIMRDLSSDWNVSAAVRRVRTQGVPQEQQANQFTDILTRSAEERRGVARRLSFAFAAGLAAADPSAFEKEECLAGLEAFFEEVYPDLCSEVPRLRSILAHELLPTLRTVLPARDLSRLLPAELRQA